MGLQLCVITFVFVVLFLRDILAVGNDLKAKKSLGTTYTVQYIALYSYSCTSSYSTGADYCTVASERERVVNSTATVGGPRK